MSRIRIELNSRGVKELLKSAEMQAGLESLASGISGNCGDGYEHDIKEMPTRTIASVFAADPDAVRDNLENNTILRNLQ